MKSGDCGVICLQLYTNFSVLLLLIVFTLNLYTVIVFICDYLEQTCENHNLLLISDLIFCSNPKANGKILLTLC